MTQAPANDLVAALLGLGSATLHEAQGQTGALAPAIKPLDPSRRLAGPAMTVKTGPGDNLALHRALTRARAGHVLVVNGGGYVDAALWGDILTLAAQTAGLAGLVVDGAVRDSEAIIDMGFPTFARGIAIGGPRKAITGSIDEPIVCGGVVINPGDWVMGDRDGLVAIARASVSDVVAAARKREVAEVGLRDGIRQGRTTVDLLGL